MKKGAVKQSRVDWWWYLGPVVLAVGALVLAVVGGEAGSRFHGSSERSDLSLLFWSQSLLALGVCVGGVVLTVQLLYRSYGKEVFQARGWCLPLLASLACLCFISAVAFWAWSPLFEWKPALLAAAASFLVGAAFLLLVGCAQSLLATAFTPEQVEKLAFTSGAKESMAYLLHYRIQRVRFLLYIGSVGLVTTVSAANAWVASLKAKCDPGPVQEGLCVHLSTEAWAAAALQYTAILYGVVLAIFYLPAISALRQEVEAVASKASGNRYKHLKDHGLGETLLDQAAPAFAMSGPFIASFVTKLVSA